MKIAISGPWVPLWDLLIVLEAEVCFALASTRAKCVNVLQALLFNPPVWRFHLGLLSWIQLLFQRWFRQHTSISGINWLYLNMNAAFRKVNHLFVSWGSPQTEKSYVIVEAISIATSCKGIQPLGLQGLINSEYGCFIVSIHVSISRWYLWGGKFCGLVWDLQPPLLLCFFCGCCKYLTIQSTVSDISLRIGTLLLGALISLA